MIVIRLESVPGMAPIAYMPDYGGAAPDSSLPDDERPKPIGLTMLDQRSGLVIEIALQEEERRAVIAMLEGRRPVQTATIAEMPGGVVLPGR